MRVFLSLKKFYTKDLERKIENLYTFKTFKSSYSFWESGKYYIFF